MTFARLAGLAVFAALCASIWFAYHTIGWLNKPWLRDYMLWELRYVILGVGVFAVLSVAQMVWDRLVRQ